MIVEWSEAERHTYTHVVAHHVGETHAVAARHAGQPVVSLLWLWECLQSCCLLNPADELV